MIALSDAASVVLGAVVGAIAAVGGAFLAGLFSLRADRKEREARDSEARRLQRSADLRAFQDAIEELGRRWHTMHTLFLHLETPTGVTLEELVSAAEDTHGYFNTVVKWASRVRDPVIDDLLEQWREVTRRNLPTPNVEEGVSEEYSAWLIEVADLARDMIRRAGELDAGS